MESGSLRSKSMVVTASAWHSVMWPKAFLMIKWPMLGEGWLFLGLTSKVAKFDSKGLKSWNGKEYERLRTLLKNTLKTLPDLFGIQILFDNLQLFLFHLKNKKSQNCS